MSKDCCALAATGHAAAAPPRRVMTSRGMSASHPKATNRLRSSEMTLSAKTGHS